MFLTPFLKGQPILQGQKVPFLVLFHSRPPGFCPIGIFAVPWKPQHAKGKDVRSVVLPRGRRGPGRIGKLPDPFLPVFSKRLVKDVFIRGTNLAPAFCVCVGGGLSPNVGGGGVALPLLLLPPLVLL